MSGPPAPAGPHPGDLEAITVTLPRPEDIAEDTARAGRMIQAATLAGELTPEGFARWMENGKAIGSGTARQKEPAPCT